MVEMLHFVQHDRFCDFSPVVYHDSFTEYCIICESDIIIINMLPDLKLNDHLRLRKGHPCGSFEWTVTRLGADIGLQCKGCGRRVMLTRRELAKRLKTNLTKLEEQNEQKTNS